MGKRSKNEEVMVKYLTWDEIPAKDRNKKGLVRIVPLNAAGVPYKVYEYNPNASDIEKYYGLSARIIKKIPAAANRLERKMKKKR